MIMIAITPCAHRKTSNCQDCNDEEKYGKVWSEYSHLVSGRLYESELGDLPKLFPCQGCGGSGWVAIVEPRVYSKSYGYSPVVEHDEMCSACGGRRTDAVLVRSQWIPCDDCQRVRKSAAGGTPCRDCRGRGRLGLLRRQKCNRCDGLGRVHEYCFSCHGKGGYELSEYTLKPEYLPTRMNQAIDFLRSLPPQHQAYLQRKIAESAATDPNPGQT